MHVHSDDPVPRASPRTTMVLAVIMSVIVAAVAVGFALTKPSNWDVLGSEQFLEEGAQWRTVDVIAFDDETGETTVVIPGEPGEHIVPHSGITGIVVEPGQQLRVVQLATGELIFSDFERGEPLMFLLVIYVLVVLLVARWRGLGALVGLALAFGVVIFYTVPALLDGAPPVLVGLVTGAGALLMLLYVAHGFNARTTTAYLGTIAGLLMTAVLGVWAASAAHIPGVPSEYESNVLFVSGTLQLSGLALCGIMLASLGLLNDVTVTQASAAWELRRARPDLGRWEVYRRTMRVGRDHIASTVYTIAFAYVGASLPLIILILAYNSSVGGALTSSEIAGEIVRTLVGSIGLVLTVPLTTAIAALVASPGAYALSPAAEAQLGEPAGSRPADQPDAPAQPATMEE